jgi:hypothetical protein
MAAIFPIPEEDRPVPPADAPPRLLRRGLREEAVACPSESHFPWEATTRIVFFPKQIPMGWGMTDR